jgi:hypothetical protein
VSIAWRTSNAFPATPPRGLSMSVTRAIVLTPAPFPMDVIARANASESFFSVMNAPDPVLTSRTSAEVPSASFFDMMLAAIKGIESTVAVTSRIA